MGWGVIKGMRMAIVAKKIGVMVKMSRITVDMRITQVETQVSRETGTIEAAIMRYVISIICNEALFMIISGHNSEVGAVRQVWQKSTTAASLQDRRNNGG